MISKLICSNSSHRLHSIFFVPYFFFFFCYHVCPLLNSRSENTNNLPKFLPFFSIVILMWHQCIEGKVNQTKCQIQSRKNKKHPIARHHNGHQLFKCLFYRIWDRVWFLGQKTKHTKTNEQSSTLSHKNRFYCLSWSCFHNEKTFKMESNEIFATKTKTTIQPFDLCSKSFSPYFDPVTW